MTNIIGVRFKKVGKVYFFDPCEQQVDEGQSVIVETTRGVEMGEVVMKNRDVEDDKIVPPLKKLIRVATDEDMRRIEENSLREQEALQICERKILEHQLEMKVIDVEYTFDNNKILFYFTADGRVDFRELVKDLASIFRTRIELRQIGVRDEAKMTGGLGICGLPFCCSTFLGEFHSVSIKMAKDQGLSLNPTKISGTCGRLMCCLKYEQCAYEDLLQKAPKNGAYVDTPEGRGVVVDGNIFRGLFKVRLDDSADSQPVEFPLASIAILKNGSGKSRPDRRECPNAAACAHKGDADAVPEPRDVSAQALPSSEPEADAATVIPAPTPIPAFGAQPAQKSAPEQRQSPPRQQGGAQPRGSLSREGHKPGRPPQRADQQQRPPRRPQQGGAPAPAKAQKPAVPGGAQQRPDGAAPAPAQQQWPAGDARPKRSRRGSRGGRRTHKPADPQGGQQ